MILIVAKDYELIVKKRIAKKYGLEVPALVDLDKAQEYELRYLRAPEREIEKFLDQLEDEPVKWNV